MDTSRDRITLTSQERSVSADLEVRAGRSDPKLARSLTVGSHRGWPDSGSVEMVTSPCYCCSRLAWW